MSDNDVLLIATGGTMDKLYNPIKGELTFGAGTQLEKILQQGQCRFPPRIRPAMLMDSLDMVDSDRIRIAEVCNREPEKRIVITHGTDTMVESARIVAERVKGKTIVLTGALTPWSMGNSDAAFNIGTALAYAQILPPNVYIAMHGRYFHWDRVLKDRDEGGFREIDDGPVN
jgi:L-asparaginase